jgi:phosphoribosylamine---glycine ligase
MRVLVLGSGGREHALAWRLAQEERVQKVTLHPGNPGTWSRGFATLGDVAPKDFKALAAAAKKEAIDLVLVGPEALLSMGIADDLRNEGFLVVGPGVQGAELESSKVFAKRFLMDAGIPTARYVQAHTESEVRAAVNAYPVVLKLDGLAAGKGVVVAETPEHLEGFISRVWHEHEFGQGNHSVVVEEFIEGKELSYIGLCDGTTFVPFSSSSDYKRLLDSDLGPNTGGMGAISPSPILNEGLEQKITARIVEPTLRQMARLKMPYRGALYFGLMVSKNQEPYVLEFNARFGDPETQALMLRLEGNFIDFLEATAKGVLASRPLPQWNSRVAVYFVAAAAGYPSEPRLGDRISGLDTVSADSQVFFSGVGQGPDGLVTGGGRVLGIGSLGQSADASRQNVLNQLKKVHWNGMHFRKDIGL